MENKALYKSLILHIAVVFLLIVEMPSFWRKDFKVEQVPIIVDLDEIDLSEITNLPSKAEVGKVAQKASVVKPQEPKPEPSPKAEQEVVKKQKEIKLEEVEKKPVKKNIVPMQPSKPKPPKKAEPKPKPKPKPQKEEPKTVKPDTLLKNLMKSVNSIEKNLGQKDNKEIIKEGTKVANMGIDGGTVGSYFSDLSITEIDAIASRLRQCWNLDPGARGIEDMIIEIRAYLNKDGTVKRVDILDSVKYKSDSHFRSIANSAKRAVYVCAPYAILAKKYGDKYDMWQTMLLRFNPITHTIN